MIVTFTSTTGLHNRGIWFLLFCLQKIFDSAVNKCEAIAMDSNSQLLLLVGTLTNFVGEPFFSLLPISLGPYSSAN